MEEHIELPRHATGKASVQDWQRLLPDPLWFAGALQVIGTKGQQIAEIRQKSGAQASFLSFFQRKSLQTLRRLAAHFGSEHPWAEWRSMLTSRQLAVVYASLGPKPRHGNVLDVNLPCWSDVSDVY